MSIELRVLGCFRLWVDGRPVQVSPASARVLGYLAVRGQPVKRTAVAAALWPDVRHERALGNLRSALWRLPASCRRAVRDSGTALGLAPDLSLDLDGIDRAAGPDHLDDVADVLSWGWREDLLAGWYDDWVIAARDLVQLRRVVALEAVSTRCCQEGRCADALVYATLAVCAAPLRESAHQALLRAHLARRRPADAVRAFEDLVAMLGRELGVGPSPETVSMMREATGIAA